MDLNIEKYTKAAIDWGINFLPRIVLFIVILLIGFAIVKRLQKVLHKAIERSNIDDEVSGFLQSIIGILLNVALIIFAVPIIGVELSALIGILAAVGFAIGFAFQGFLGNYASGLTIIFFKPYRVGDWVEISDYFGKVKSIQIFNTILITPGQKTLVIPNGQVTDNIITNFSTEGQIRLELTIPIGYEQSFPKIKQIIETALKEVDIILHEPKPEIGIESYDSHTLNVTVRPCIHPDNYWNATFDVNQVIKSALSQNGIVMTYSEGVENGPIGE